MPTNGYDGLQDLKATAIRRTVLLEPFSPQQFHGAARKVDRVQISWEMAR
jgi:hypothetical protein